MKKSLAFILALVLAFAGCALAETAVTEDVKSEGVMTFAEYAAAELDTPVVVETYVQAKQGWWEKDGVGVASIYTQDHDGAYFFYNMPCSKEDYDKMVVGTKIRVSGYKIEFAGLKEIDAESYEILEGSYIAEPLDVTELLAAEELIEKQGMYVSFKGMTVAPASEDNAEAAFIYNYDGSGQDGDDLYFNVTLGENTYTFTVESYLCGADTEVYQAVKALKVGDVIDMEGFLYWYEGVNPHITAVTAAVAE